ncbi:MAG TPA: CBS domain-containing protein [Mycobacteriales bacterium]|nr:CBS domain-containing protein [Mycobacteriales bacterium]
MQVADVMTSVRVSGSPSGTLRDAAARMWEQQTGSLLVMDGDHLLGIVTERDVVRAVAQGGNVDTATVGEIMTPDVFTVPPDMALYEAARLMVSRWVRHLPVVDSDEVVGVLSLRDLVAVLAAMGRETDDVRLPADELVRSRRLARIEAGDLD